MRIHTIEVYADGMRSVEAYYDSEKESQPVGDFATGSKLYDIPTGNLYFYNENQTNDPWEYTCCLKEEE